MVSPFSAELSYRYEPHQPSQFFPCEAKYVSELGIIVKFFKTDVTCFFFQTFMHHEYH